MNINNVLSSVIVILLAGMIYNSCNNSSNLKQALKKIDESKSILNTEIQRMDSIYMALDKLQNDNIILLDSVNGLREETDLFIKNARTFYSDYYNHFEKYQEEFEELSKTSIKPEDLDKFYKMLENAGAR